MAAPLRCKSGCYTPGLILCALHMAILRAAHQLFVYHHRGLAGGILPSCDGRWQAHVSVAQWRAAECPQGRQLSPLDVFVGRLEWSTFFALKLFA